MRAAAIALVFLLAGVARAEDRTPHELTGGELARVSRPDPYTVGPAQIPGPVRIGPGVTAVQTGDGVVVSCEPAHVEIYRLREQLRLRSAELLVVRGQLAAAQRRAAKP